MSYDEQAELARYVWNHYSHLMSNFEREVGRAALARDKAAASSDSTIGRVISERWGRTGDPAVSSALSAGSEAFRHAASLRVLSERSDAVAIKRCHKCRCISRTPEAKQCFWCGHDWHVSE